MSPYSELLLTGVFCFSCLSWVNSLDYCAWNSQEIRKGSNQPVWNQQSCHDQSYWDWSNWLWMWSPFILSSFWCLMYELKLLTCVCMITRTRTEQTRQKYSILSAVFRTLMIQKSISAAPVLEGVVPFYRSNLETKEKCLWHNQSKEQKSPPSTCMLIHFKKEIFITLIKHERFIQKCSIWLRARANADLG